VKKYADMAGVLTGAVEQFAAEVRGREFPGPEHTFH
jgi:3-methyl-2-oxobutanoate hydroxymethyltransferase